MYHRKKQRRKLEKQPIERAKISTTPAYDLKKIRHKRCVPESSVRGLGVT